MSDKVIPRHIGYILDGNRRWAKKHGLPTYEGHLAGYNALKEVAIATRDAGVEYMTVYAFSTENWSRSAEEINKLMGLMFRAMKADLNLFIENNIRLRIIGSAEGLDKKLIEAMKDAEDKTSHMTGGTLAVCFNYGGQAEIVNATRALIQEGVKAEDVTEESIEQHLYAADLPPIDLVVRTSGEHRLSNFMTWRTAYSELLFLDKFWPEMTKIDVKDILEEYNKRHRRFGG